LKNETGHKLDFKYTGPYKVESIEKNDNIVQITKIKFVFHNHFNSIINISTE